MFYPACTITVFTNIMYSVSAIPSFTSSPKLVGSYRGKSAKLTWTLSEGVNKDWYSIELFYNKQPTPTAICSWFNDDPDNVKCREEYQTRVRASISVDSATISWTLYNIQSNDVTHNYICSVTYDTFQPAVKNNKGWIMLYDTPDTPVIKKSSNAVENRVFTMRCSARSTSILPSNLPTDLKPVMEYRWQRDKQDLTNDDRHRVGGEAGNTLTIDQIQREDNKKTYTCIAHESGSKFSRSNNITLNVMYKPGAARAEFIKIGPYFEGHSSDVKLNCSVSDPGNPEAMFQWSKDGINKSQPNQGYYIISRGQLSVSGHDGVWQCTPYNRIGKGQPATIQVIVYAKPIFQKNLTNQSPRAEIQSDLDVLCSIRGRPAPDVIWQYNDSDLPDDVTVTPESDVINDKLTTVSRRLTWSTESRLPQRRNTSGIYTCIGRVDNKETKQSINIDVQYAPYNIKLIPSGTLTKTENDSLTLTCAATCNPACNYSWTRGNQQVSVGQKLIFTSIKRQHQGYYRCTASNGIGTDQGDDVSIQVNYPPELTTIQTPSGDINQSSEVTITCIVDSRPEPSSITWTNITVPGLAAVVGSEKNNTHCWLTLSDINILDSGTFQCQADNGVGGSPVTINKTLTVYGPARWYKADPVGFVKGVSIGDSTDFKVWVIARPLPEQDQWKWKFSPSNSSNVMTTNPGHVQLTVSGDMAVLSITSVTLGHYGNYYIWTKNKYGGWNEEDLTFSLKPQGPPLKPINFSVVDVTAVSIRVQWITGFNGGLEQTFIIRYTNLATRVVMEKSGIEDRGVGDGQMITDDITDGIEPETEYQLQIFASNSQGQTAGDVISLHTPALAKFSKDPEIIIQGDEAEIHFVISGQLTHIKVENCLEDTDDCVTEDVRVPDKTRKSRQTTRVYDFLATVTLIDPDAKYLIFYFWIYDGDVLLTSEPAHVNINNAKDTHKLILGIILGIIFIIAVSSVIIIILWRKGLLTKKRDDRSRHHNRTPRMKENSEMHNTDSVNEQQYEMPSQSGTQTSRVSTTYQSLLGPEINIHPASSVVLDSLFRDGHFYQIWKGKLTNKKAKPLHVMIKQTKESTDVYMQYLSSQGHHMTKLRSCDYIIACLGMTSDFKQLIVEAAPSGDLKQYLETRANETYYNVTCSQSLEMTFINQIIEGVEAVHQLDPPGLFYCLSASNVLFSGDKKCKLSGFASIEAVRAREKWEEENNLPRPIQWLSPEAIKLNHIVQSDVWSFGVLMWEVISGGKLPFGDISNNEAKQKVLNGQKPVKPLKCSGELFDIMTQCWMQQPYNRPRLNDIKLKCLDILQYEDV